MLNLGGGAARSFDKEVNPNDTGEAPSYNAYALVEFYGAATELSGNFGDDRSDQWVYGAGATYEWEDWMIGLGWTHGDYEKAVSANGVGPFNAGHDIVSLTAAYELPAGMSIDGVLQYARYRSRDAAGPDYQGLSAGLGTYIAF